MGFPEGIGVVLWGLRDTEVTATPLEPYISISPSDASAWSLFVPLAKPYFEVKLGMDPED